MNLLAALQNHPFAVEATFDYSLVLTYAVPEYQLRQLLPPCLKPDTLNEKWGFVAAAIVKTSALRPKGFPSFFGQDFILTGYRIFVQYQNQNGKRLRGLYILKSEIDKKRMAFLGNIFTHYNYVTTDIKINHDTNYLKIFSAKSLLNVEVSLTGEPSLPVSSPFKDWKEARRFAGPLPFTFTYDSKQNEVLIIEGVRTNWMPRPVQTLYDDVSFVKQLGLTEVKLANAFLLENIAYYWKKGRVEKWKQ